ncbi:putative molybdopterin cofactor sulfurase [Hibiscus syriacus]|uniref:Prolyl endopeptidase-like n=1 Tax=Hibiscus syriacus TaxID=106335 RepID=A0A6A2Y879_HIBSY|nr:putative molybdopterin cofactor sulfurase [Hibiscus syriacus]
MDMYMEQEEKYTEAVMSDTERLQTKLQSEMASRLNFDLSTPPVRWGPCLYYRRVEEGKQYTVLCRRLASLNEEFISHKSPSSGFDFTSGKRIEQKLLDYNQEAERFGGYAYEELSEVSPDHKFLAYTIKLHANHVSNLAWVKDGQALLYVVTDENKRPYRIYCSMIGSTDEDVLLQEEKDENVYVFLINAADPFSGMTLAWGELSPVDSSSNPRIWENVFIDSKDLVIEDVDFCKSHLVLITREGRNHGICSVALPLPDGKQAVHLRELQPHFLPLPKNVCSISPGPNYDYNSQPCDSQYYHLWVIYMYIYLQMPDAVVDYDLSNGKWNIVQQQNMLHERTRILYGTALSSAIAEKTTNVKFSSMNDVRSEENNLWNDLSEFYACEHHNVSSYDGAMVPLTIVYSQKNRKDNQSLGLLHGHGAYGEILDKRWRSELKSLLDRGWIIAYADVRGGGSGENKLVGWGYSVGGLLVASAINCCPDLFRAAVLKVPFLDATNTLLYLILPLTAADYEEFGYPGDIDEFYAIRKFSSYDNIQKDALYPAVLVSSSFNTRFGVWEAAKWVTRVREQTIYDPKHPILNLITDIVEKNRYLQCKETAMETAFLINAMDE